MLKRLLHGFDPRISAELYEQRRPIVAGLLCSAASAALISLTGVLLKFILDSIENKQYDALGILSLVVLGMFTVKYFFTRGQSYYLTEAATRLTNTMRRKLFAKLLRLPISYFNEKRAGGIQSVLTNDVGVYQSAITALRDSIDGPIRVGVGLAVIIGIQYKLTLATMLVMPVMVWFIQKNARKMKIAQADVQNDLGGLTAFMQESLQGTRIIKAFGAEGASVDRFSEYSEKALQSQLRAARRVATLKPMVELIGAVALAIVVFLCGRLAQNGELNVGQLGAFVFTLDTINKGIQSIGSLKQTKAQVQAASERIHAEILDIPEVITDRADAKSLPAPQGLVEFRNVSFAYPDGTEALQNVSFCIKPGESMALVGPSGAGKSTIADLLLRFYDPTSGQVLYDGVDIRELNSEWYRAQIGVVPQQTFLFAGTISENIRLAHPRATEAEVGDASSAAHASGFIAEMPTGMLTQLGERGVRLSGGQAQRIAIARALVRKPRVLLLDEATSNLDSVSEKAVQEALDEIMPGRTTLYIAHRLTTAARATKILLLKKGEILEQGSYRELMEQNGAFAKMYQAFVAGGLGDESL